MIPFTADAIRASVSHPLPTIHLHDSLDSTNTRCKALAESGAPAGTVVIAKAQTAGRGRMGRQFFSPRDTGLYMSILLRPDIPPAEALSITTCAAAAVSEAIESLSGRTAQIKWVNDVYLDGRKVCGILTEAAFTPDGTALRYAVLGIGVNLAPPEGDFPPELSHIAASVWQERDADYRGALACGILDRFFAWYPRLAEKPFYAAYRSRMFLIGRPVQILWGQSTGEALCLDVDRDFRLVVQYPDGRTEAISSGEVSVRWSD